MTQAWHAAASIAHLVDEYTDRGWGDEGRAKFAAIVKRRLERFWPAPIPTASPSHASDEAVAELVYAAMVWGFANREAGPAPAWVPRGNSTAQDAARSFARTILNLAPASPSGAHDEVPGKPNPDESAA